jgi:hypothetical protein
MTSPVYSSNELTEARLFKYIFDFTLSSPPLVRDQLDKLIEAVCPPEGQENYLEWFVSEKGELDYLRKKSEK